jgi:hypothetical protein
MKYRLPLVLVAAAATLAGAWMLVRPPELAGYTPGGAVESAPNAGPAAPSAAPKLSASSVLSIDPRALSLGTALPVKVRATLFSEFLGAKTYRALYDRLKDSSEGQTPEGKYVMYEMMRRCAAVSDRRAAPRNVDQKRDEFMAALPSSDPLRDKRIAAFEEVTVNRCAGLENVAMSQADLNRMLADAAAAGDPKAQALAMEQELWAARRAAGREGQWGRNSVTLSDAQITAMQGLAASRDPEAMLIAGRMLSTSWHDLTLRAGPDGQPVEQRAFMQAWQLLACDYGYPCGDNNPRVLSACAYQGHCNASSLPDYLYYYGASPNDSQLMSQYREILRTAIETGNWSQMSVTRGPRPPGTPMFGFNGIGPR